MSRINARHIDLYEPGTRRERGYMCGISSVYKEDSMDDAATIATATIQKDIEGYTQDVEWDLEDLKALE